MPKLPPRGDERFEDIYPSHPHQPRAHASSRRKHINYYSDEHPEVPRVKRASRHLDELPAPPRAKLAPPDSPANIASRTRRPSGKSAKSHAATQEDMAPFTERLPSVYTSRQGSRKLRNDIHEPPAQDPETGKIAVTPRLRPLLHEPLTPKPRTKTKLRRRSISILTQLQDISRHRAFIPVILFVLVSLIILPIAANALRNNGSQLLSTSSNPGNSASSQPGTSRANNVHELVITPQDTDHPAPPMLARSAYLLDADTGATLYAHNPFMHLPMLSTTKLMTALIAVETGKLEQKITITDPIAHDLNQLSADSSLMGIKKGETYTLNDLLYGLLLVSGNDAAIAIADGVGKSVTNFVAEMNQRAHQLGMNDTHYMNPHGLLTTGHYSSAHDLALIGRYSMNNPIIHKISGTRQYHIAKSAEHAEHGLINGNQFLWWYPGVDGGKPGWDGAANFIQVISCTRNGHHLIGVTMHTSDWWTDMRNLMNWGFSTFNWVSPHDADISNPPIPYDNDWNYFVKDKKENTIPTADKGRYFIFTGYSVTGPILSYFDKNGGLQKLGYPVDLPKMSANVLSQRFEHATIQCDLSVQRCSTAR
ncbi:D-alanyl-D-alanine carboxypeptidase [Ktedonosporobacter rubrisoli]|uniref:D-alanyl-D-alanine carboxypeptidase n=1 Tax=Ktedonosporobacter rubrisoli TaxID=2509675 RepID=A0A4P6K0P0_KTERU|nr:D-alanyl-D-alanine carboxypeptidase family protein [Ktedonosporobacter rubrisoli]QBD81707.1 D-alanyl-D-alanine carboxypeptidase [Ktedonosporobacter rubrisoli]